MRRAIHKNGAWLRGGKPILPIVAFAALFILLVPGTSRAQCEMILDTGCVSSLPTSCLGSAAVGETLGLYCGFSGASILIGQCAVPRIPIPATLLCSGPCYLAVDPSASVVLFFMHLGALAIPNDPRLIGATLCMQCLTPGPGGCLRDRDLYRGTRFTITP